MSDNLKLYHIIRQGLEQLYPTKLCASDLRSLRTLSLVIHGLIASSHCHLSQLARKMPAGMGGKLESRIKRLARFMANENVTTELFFLPYVKPLLAALTQSSGRVLKISLDGSTMGRGCLALVASVVYAGRALPISWLVVKGKKGHLSQKRHLELVEAVHELLGVQCGCPVLVLGDGEFDGTGLLARLAEYGWHYVVRTAKNAVLYQHQQPTNFGALALEKGQLVGVPQAQFTLEKYGPVLAIAVWEGQYDQPLYLISNLSEPYQAASEYKRRFRIECFFSDTKTRGFKLDKSHLNETSRLSRLLLGAALAYWWLTYLGVKGRREGWDKLVHRGDRTDLSFFQLGWRILEEFLRCGRDREVPFGLTLSTQALF